MDLSNIMIPPDMGVDYGSLLRYAQPNGGEDVVAGGNPAGNIGTAGMAGYLGQKQAERDAMLQKASQLADLQAQLKTGQAQDYQSAAPQRQAQIQIGNSLAQGKVADLPTMLAQQHSTISAGANTASAEDIQSLKSKLYPFAQDWHEAKTDEDRQNVIDDMKSKGLTQIGARNIDDIPPDKLDPLMQQAYTEQINTPKHIQELQIAKANAEAAMARTQAIVGGRKDVAEIGAKSREEVARGHDAAKQAAASIMVQKPQNQSQWYASMLKKMEDGTITDQEKDTLTYYQKAALAKAAASAQNSPQEPDMGDLGVKVHPKVIPTPPAIPNTTKKVPPEAVAQYKKDIAADPARKTFYKQKFMEALKVDPDTIK